MTPAPDQDDDDEPLTIFEVALDDVSVARLIEMSEATKTEPCVLLRALVQGILEDDARAHGQDVEIDPNVGKYTH